MNRIADRPEEEGLWTKERSNPDVYIALTVGVALTLLHSGWYNLVLFAVIALGGLIASAMSRRSPGAALSILSKQ